MKKVVLALSTFALVAVFAACGGSPESTGKKVAEKECECGKIRKEAFKSEDEKEQRDLSVKYTKCGAEANIMDIEAKKAFYDDTAALRKYRDAKREAWKECENED